MTASAIKINGYDKRSDGARISDILSILDKFLKEELPDINTSSLNFNASTRRFESHKTHDPGTIVIGSANQSSIKFTIVGNSGWVVGWLNCPKAHAIHEIITKGGRVRTYRIGEQIPNTVLEAEFDVKHIDSTETNEPNIESTSENPLEHLDMVLLAFYEVQQDHSGFVPTRGCGKLVIQKLDLDIPYQKMIWPIKRLVKQLYIAETQIGYTLTKAGATKLEIKAQELEINTLKGLQQSDITDWLSRSLRLIHGANPQTREHVSDLLNQSFGLPSFAIEKHWKPALAHLARNKGYITIVGNKISLTDRGKSVISEPTQGTQNSTPTTTQPAASMPEPDQFLDLMRQSTRLVQEYKLAQENEGKLSTNLESLKQEQQILKDRLRINEKNMQETMSSLAKAKETINSSAHKRALEFVRMLKTAQTIQL